MRMIEVINMPNYKKMYYKLFNKITNVIDELQEIQRETQEMYTTCSKAKIVLLNDNNDKNDGESE